MAFAIEDCSAEKSGYHREVDEQVRQDFATLNANRSICNKLSLLFYRRLEVSAQVAIPDGVPRKTDSNYSCPFLW
ncbi:MAG: hypothetical protein K2H36_01645 [Clostridia bacterium]|nr:hypothetical protein [Clostridia bacterium]